MLRANGKEKVDAADGSSLRVIVVAVEKPHRLNPNEMERRKRRIEAHLRQGLRIERNMECRELGQATIH